MPNKVLGTRIIQIKVESQMAISSMHRIHSKISIYSFETDFSPVIALTKSFYAVITNRWKNDLIYNYEPYNLNLSKKLLIIIC